MVGRGGSVVEKEEIGAGWCVGGRRVVQLAGVRVLAVQ